MTRPNAEALFPCARLTDDQRMAIAKRYRAGERAADLAREFDVAESYPPTLAARYGLARPPRKAWAKEAARLDAMGMTRLVIAARLGVSDTRVCAVLGPKLKPCPLPKWSPIRRAIEAGTVRSAL